MTDLSEPNGLQAVSLGLLVSTAFGHWWLVLPIVVLPGLIMSVVCRSHRVLLRTNVVLLVLPSLEMWREGEVAPLGCLLLDPFMPSGVIDGLRDCCDGGVAAGWRVDPLHNDGVLVRATHRPESEGGWVALDPLGLPE